MDEINDFLNGESEAEVVAETPEPEETPEIVEADGPARDEKGRFAPKGETPAEPEVASPTTEEPKLEHPALIGERRRRQEAEERERQKDAELAQLRAQINPPPPPADMFDNPEGWQNQFGSQLVNTAVQQATLNAKLDMSEMMVRQSNPDFDDMKAAFLDLAKDNPTLAQQALADAHPWNKAYQIAKTHKTMQEVGATDVASLTAAIEARLRAELQAQTPVTPAPIPDTLADAQSARGSSASPVPVAPTLDDILRR
jgi:hypothetical protein